MTKKPITTLLGYKQLGFHIGNKPVVPIINNRFLSKAILNDNNIIQNLPLTTLNMSDLLWAKSEYYQDGMFERGVRANLGWSYVKIQLTHVNVKRTRSFILPSAIIMRGKVLKEPSFYGVAGGGIWLPLSNYISFGRNNSGEYTWNDYPCDAIRIELTWNDASNNYTCSMYAIEIQEDLSIYKKLHLFWQRSYTTLQILWEFNNSSKQFMYFNFVDDDAVYEFDFKIDGYYYN